MLFVEAHEALLTSRSGADHKDTRSDHAGDGQEAKVVSSGPDPGDQLSSKETNEGAKERWEKRGYDGLFDRRKVGTLTNTRAGGIDRLGCRKYSALRLCPKKH